MRCNSCGMEWTGPATFTSQISICPFCGNTLNSVTPQFSSMHDVLSYIVENFGLETMREGMKLQSLFADLAPSLKREKIMLRHFIECDGNNVLLSAIHNDKQEARAQITRVIQRMEDELMVMPDIASAVCHSFWCAVGGSPDLISESFSKPKVSTYSEKNLEPQTTAKPTMQKQVSDTAWRQSEAAHRQWIQSQSATVPINNTVIKPPARREISEEERLRMAHDHWSKSQSTTAPKPTPQSIAPAKSTSQPIEDWKRSEAAHRAWLNSQKNK